MIAAVAVIVMCAAGLVGAGYAYTATTTNSGNNATTEYIEIHQDGNGAYTFTSGGTTNVKWNTTDYKSGENYYTDFTLDTATSPTAIQGTSYNLVQVGQDITIKTAQTGGTPASINCAIGASGFTYNANSALFIKVTVPTNEPTYTYMKLTETGFKTWNNGSWSGAASFEVVYQNTAFLDSTVQVFYGIPAEPGYIHVQHVKGTAAVGPSVGITGATLTFRITTVADTPVTGVAISSATLDLTTQSQDTQLTATVAPAGDPPTGATNKNVMWSSSNENVVTVDHTGLVHVVGAGVAVIMVMTVDGGYHAECTVTVANT